MTEDVGTVSNERSSAISQTKLTEQQQLQERDQQSLREGADRVSGARVGAELTAGGDGFDRTQATTGDTQLGATGNLHLASTGNIQLASNGGVPIGLFTSTSSPIDSTGAVDRMRTLGALGTPGAAAGFDRSRYNDLISRDPGAPFTGSGATGVSPTQGSIPLGDMASLARFHQGERDLVTLGQQRTELMRAQADRPAGLSPEMEQRRQELIANQLRLNQGNIDMTQRVMDHLRPTVDSYRNPLSENPAVSADPRAHWDQRTRERQAELMLNQPINTLHAGAYGNQLPTRADVVNAAARQHNLDPNVLAGFLLHEQRDQSRKEDAADFGGATLAGRDTSIGLGQILMSTATRDNAAVLQDTVDAQTRAGLSRNDVARLLTSDEHNIFAAARYLRSVADLGAGVDPATLPNTRGQFPGLDPSQYRGSNWGDDNIRAVASEYSSRPWDDRVFPAGGYPQSVLDAVNDIRRARIFGR